MYKALYDSIAHSEKLADLSDYGFRLWTCGLAVSDALGRITVNPRVLHAKATPMSPYEEGKMLAALNEIKEQGLAHFYEVDGKPYMVFHDHEHHNKSHKNLQNIRPECPAPPPGLCICIILTKSEESSVVPPIGEESPPIGEEAPPIGVPVPVPLTVLDSRPDDVRPAIRHLQSKAKEAKIPGRKETLISYLESWVARTKDAGRVEQILMDPWTQGKTVIEIQDRFFPKDAESTQEFRSKRDAFPKF